MSLVQLSLFNYLNNFLSEAIMFTPTILAGVCLIGSAIAQTSTFFSPGVPTDAPIPGKTFSNLTAKPLYQSLQCIGNYTGQYRPRVHFSPPQVSTPTIGLLKLFELPVDIRRDRNS